jgi:hypothetical protein
VIGIAVPLPQVTAGINAIFFNRIAPEEARVKEELLGLASNLWD